MESAVRSGFLAAERVLECKGMQVQIASPLPQPEGLAALFAPSRRSMAAP